MINTIAALQGLYVALGGDIGDVANINTIPDMLEAVASVAGGGSGSLPEVTSDDNGDILGVVEGAWAKRDPELPTVVATDIGDVLQVVSDGEEGAIWGKGAIVIPSELPSVEAADIGDVLTVVSDGESGAEWAKAALPTPEQTTVLYKGTLSGSNFNLSDSKTLGDIKTDLAAGKVVVLGIVNTDTADTYQNKYFYLSTGSYKVQPTSYPHFQWSFIAYDQTNGVYHFEHVYVQRAASDSTATFSYTNANLPLLPVVSSSDNDKILKVVNGVWTAVLPQ